MRVAWVVAIASASLALAITLVLSGPLRPGARDAAHHAVVAELVNEHTRSVWDRLIDLEVDRLSHFPCPLEWRDEYPVAGSTYVVRSRIVLAAYVPARHDFVTTCDDQASAEAYAIILEASWPNAPAAITLEYVAPRNHPDHSGRGEDWRYGFNTHAEYLAFLERSAIDAERVFGIEPEQLALLKRDTTSTDASGVPDSDPGIEPGRAFPEDDQDVTGGAPNP
jgi:hypothetical protein